MPTILIHIQNEDPVLGEVDDLPGPADILLLLKNPRRKDGKDLHYLEQSVTTVIWPMSRVNFIEVMPNEQEDDIISHVRD